LKQQRGTKSVPPGLGDELIDEILAAADRARQNPELFRTVHRHGKIRRVLTNRFPYRIFFSVVGETLYVHAVLHGARHDRRWIERLYCVLYGYRMRLNRMK
jgi:toxin ParE1/3/4